MTTQELRDMCLADSRLKPSWLNLWDAMLEVAEVRTRVAFAKHAKKLPEPADESDLKLLMKRFHSQRNILMDALRQNSISTKPPVLDELIELAT